MSAAKHTPLRNAAFQSGHASPLPWSIEVDAYGTNIIAADGSRVAYVHSCSCNSEADSDAALIVRAANAHSDLLAALVALRDWDDHPAMNGRPAGTRVPETTPSFDKTIKMVHAAIAKARGGA